MNKQMPHSIEAEKSVLSACLIGGSKEALSLLTYQDFYMTSHQLVFRAVAHLVKRGDPVDLISVINVLKTAKKMDECGGVAGVSKICDFPASTGIEHHARIIKEKAIKRRLIEKCSAVMQDCFDDKPIDELVLKSKSVQIKDSSSLIDRKRMVDISNVYPADRMLTEYSRYVETLKNNRFITGIGEIDKRIRGVAGGETLFIMARAGAYKTAMLQNMLRNYVNASSWGAAFFSLEMPVANITERYLQQFDSASGKDIEQLYKSKEIDPISALEHRFKSELKRFFVVPTKVSLNDIEQYVKLIEDEFKLKIGVIGIDYLGLVDEPGKEYEANSKIATGSKDLAKYLNIPVVMLSQLNRKGESGKTEVSLEMGRGSGAIEEAADFVIGQWKDGNDLVAKILKNRKGPSGSKWVLDLNPGCFWIGPDTRPWVKKQNHSSKDYCDQ